MTPKQEALATAAMLGLSLDICYEDFTSRREVGIYLIGNEEHLYEEGLWMETLRSRDYPTIRLFWKAVVNECVSIASGK